MTPQVDLSVEHPAGGVLHMQTAEECDLWNRSLSRYREDYILIRQNDLFSLAQLLQSQILLFRAQTAINGMVPETDSAGVPTGRYKRVDLDAADLSVQHRVMTESSKEMRALEKQLGIDKATREAGGAHTVDQYVTTLKQAAHHRGIHISKRFLEYEAFVKEMTTKLRMLYGADAEDRAYHNISPKAILDWEKAECDRLDQVDKDHAKDFGKLFIGKL